MKGATHSINRCNAEYAAAQDQIEALQARCEALEASVAAAETEIGKLRDELETGLEKAREAFRSLKGQH